ncbi:MAG: carboxymuconolactone decarboxylase family protein [Renibacterium sp.]|nr:carboxymuconolactone decarboxylase family protein [Renibacterium sp.]
MSSPDHVSGRYLAPLPEELSPEQLAVYRSIAEGPRKSEAGLVPVVDEDGRLLGPFALMAIAPGLGGAVQAVGSALRFHGAIPAAARELAILMVAVHHQCDFEWFAHERAARAAGLTEQQLAAVRSAGKPEGLDAHSAAVWQAVGALLSRETLDAAEYAEATAALGQEQLIELVWLKGYYAMLATALAAFDPVLPAAANGVLSASGNGRRDDQSGVQRVPG